MRRLSGLAVLLMLVAACGGGSGGYDSADEVAKGFGCSGTKPIANDDLEFFVTEGLDCKFKGQDMTVNWFKSGDGLENYKAVADEMGGTFILYGDNFAVECADRANCDAIQEKVGGEVG